MFEHPVALFQAVGLERDDRILEVGCAIAYPTLPLARIASEGKAIAVDVWEEGLAYLAHRAASVGSIEVIHRNGDAVDLDAGSLDKVVCFDTLHELESPEEALKTWPRFLKEEGRLLYRDPEIPPEEIEPLSDGRSRHAGLVRDVDIFVAG